MPCTGATAHVSVADNTQGCSALSHRRVIIQVTQSFCPLLSCYLGSFALACVQGFLPAWHLQERAVFLGPRTNTAVTLGGPSVHWQLLAICLVTSEPLTYLLYFPAGHSRPASSLAHGRQTQHLSSRQHLWSPSAVFPALRNLESLGASSRLQ